ncbi:amino acid ABC transporter permease [Maritimibacter sp. DP1N21-5]|uniref:amino acid ABC transporter permease n=1 Tax=Maritimibacter sp. DP1N21-5 TaxID=2836867 RepID=UPI001C48B517|nr:amino acid ABC transporter permease [Maritimibacter sp. DP1N21-5]MBV7408148.1 amino acid ABC transporter permease [Maritimibacter sp. DP1N21-5]
MSDYSFVRTDMLPEKEPPVTSVGVIGWMRQNLFSGWFNSIVTVALLVLVVWVMVNLLSWVLTPTWNAQSLSECREIIAALAKEHGACWGVIRERWIQLLFGFYPSELYWRPILTLLLLFVAMAPILFSGGVPRQLLYVSAAFPFLAPWLMWGGTFWLPLMVAGGLLIGYLAFRFLSPVIGSLGGTLAAILLPILWWLFAVGPVAEALHSILPIGIQGVESRLFGGFMLSVWIGVVAIGISLPLGIVLALGRQSDLMIVKYLSVGFIEFIRGVPLITLLFVASTLLNIFMPPGTNFDIILRVMIMATLFASAYMAEVIRGGLAALPRGQYEAADALGLDYWRAQRLIIMPQALKISIPGIVSTFIGLFKDTTLVSIIGLLDPLGLSTSIRADANWNGIVWELYGFIAILFFLSCFSMSRYSMYLERKLRTDNS